MFSWNYHHKLRFKPFFLAMFELLHFFSTFFLFFHAFDIIDKSVPLSILWLIARKNMYIYENKKVVDNLMENFFLCEALIFSERIRMTSYIWVWLLLVWGSCGGWIVGDCLMVILEKFADVSVPKNVCRIFCNLKRLSLVDYKSLNSLCCLV